MKKLFPLMFMLLSVALGNNENVNYPYEFTYDGNPLVRTHGAADPDAHVWDDVVWVYCSQDHERINGDTYATMDGYHAFSSTDLVHWTDHGEVLHSRDVSWGVDGFMWAPGAARKNGKYYLYYPHKDKSGDWKVGVAISDVPQGPFKDIGKPIEDLSGIDPAIFIDDDGQAYIYNGHYIVAKLKENMIELAEEPKKLEYAPPEILEDDKQRFHEGPFMHKRNGIYYFSYSNFKNEKYQGWYAMGDNPYGPFEWKGPMAPNPQGAQDHHSVIKFKGQWYYFYHVAVEEYPPNKEGQGRIACFDRLYYNDDGTIQLVAHTYGPTKVLERQAVNGAIHLEPRGGVYTPGSKVNLRAQGDLGYTFDSWEGALSGNANPAELIMDADMSVTANFKPTSVYSLSIHSENGVVLLNPPGGKYNAGTVVTLIPVDDFGYDFSTWGGDLAGTKKPATITMDEDKSVAARFNPVPTYRVTTDAEHGIIKINPSGALFEAGTEVTLTAKEDYGYAFTSWGGDASGTNNPVTVRMNADKHLAADFKDKGGGKVVFATNCGGDAFRSDDGVSYRADTSHQGGGAFSKKVDIADTLDDVLYGSERMGAEFGYNIPLPNGKYEVTLMFAEIYFNAAGKRIFNVEIEGDQVADHLDIAAEVQANTPYVKSHIVDLQDGQLNLVLSAVKDNAKISAIRIVEHTDSK